MGVGRGADGEVVIEDQRWQVGLGHEAVVNLALLFSHGHSDSANWQCKRIMPIGQMGNIGTLSRGIGNWKGTDTWLSICLTTTVPNNCMSITNILILKAHFQLEGSEHFGRQHVLSLLHTYAIVEATGQIRLSRN